MHFVFQWGKFLVSWGTSSSSMLHTTDTILPKNCKSNVYLIFQLKNIFCEWWGASRLPSVLSWPVQLLSSIWFIFVYQNPIPWPRPVFFQGSYWYCKYIATSLSLGITFLEYSQYFVSFLPHVILFFFNIVTLTISSRLYITWLAVLSHHLENNTHLFKAQSHT